MNKTTLLVRFEELPIEINAFSFSPSKKNKQSRSGQTHKKTMKQRKKEMRKQTNRETKKAIMAENLQILQKIGTPQRMSPNSISQN